MQEHVQLTQKEINQTLLSGVLGMPKWWLGLVTFLALVFLSGAGAFGYMVDKGVGVTGLNRPVTWGIFMVNFVFWIGISHAGIMISAILRLTQAEWRRPATRAAEVMTVFSLTAALMAAPLVHVGRPWRAILWIFPYDFSRGVWPNIRSPFIWDPSAIMTYLMASSLFVFIALLPDMAVIRDRAKSKWARSIYAKICLGWRGTPRQWKLQAVGGILLSALVLPVFVSVHSIVSWDFAVNIGVDSWHSTIFAPYFIIGAIHSGVAAVAMIMALMVWLWKWDKVLRPDHFDAIGRLLIIVATTWFFFFFLEFVFALYTLDAQEIAVRELLFRSPYIYLFITFLVAAYLLPAPLWMFKKVRRSAKWMFWTAVSVNIGMWLERFLIIIPGVARKTPFTFDWGTYHPSIVEILMVAATFAWVALGILLFSKMFPLIPLFNIKEEMVLRDEIKIGRRTVAATIRE